MAKTAQKKTVEELIKKSEKALGDPRLVEIVKNALLTKDGKVNLTKVHDQAFEHVFNETKDLQKAKEFATSTRWLAMLKRDYPEEFEFLDKNRGTILGMSQKTQESKPEPKDAEIELIGDIIFRTKGGIWLGISGEDFLYSGMKMAADLLEIITNVEPNDVKGFSFPPIKWGFQAHFRHDDEKALSETERLSALRDYLIQILEEKFGLTIRI